MKVLMKELKLFGRNVVTERGDEKVKKCNTIAYLASSGHSGSTLLDMLIGLLPNVTGVGEFSRLSIFAKDRTITPCTCGLDILDCPFWMKVQAGLRMRLNNPTLTLDEFETAWAEEPRFRVRDVFHILGSKRAWNIASLLFPSVQRYKQQLLNGKDIFDIIAEQNNTSIIFDSTKDAGRLSGLSFEFPDEFRLIYQVRDGRAVALSEMKREGIGMKLAAQHWLHMNRKINWAARGVPAEHRMFTKYEDLCSNPRDEIFRIAKFIGAKPELPEEIILNKEVCHNIGGNPMRFRKTELRVRLDEKWKSELSNVDLNTFDNICGDLNRSFGYET